MEMDSIQKQETFDIWKSKISERINDWKGVLSKSNQKFDIDYSRKSLIDLENYLIANYNLSSLEEKEQNRILDACVSYMGEIMLKLIPDSKWDIYLDDISNVYYGLPCIVTLYSGSISVHFMLREILTQNDGKVLKSRIDKILTFENTIKKQLK